ncbi:Shikimate O-hydroxycinnamoyltransferase [Nymphaea thermarum]|nr:Shikimate O-hydroxycinnamoyltransferase [Nymphaea thermarum]
MAINGFLLYESSTGYFSVHVKSRELITAELPFPEIWLPLSNIDLLLPPIDCIIYSIYRKPSSKPDLSFGSAVEILKKCLAKVLVHYYPLAGEMVTNSSCEPEILCNNMGIEFIEAHADIELRGVKLHDPDTTVQGKRVPPTGRGSRELITAELPFPEIWLPLSNIDLLLPPIDCIIYSIYRKPSSKPDLSFGSAVEILKKCLAKVLVHYYPLAGEMVTNSSGEPEILCNNMGIEFSEAHADIELNGLKLHDPDATMQGKLVAPKGRGVLSVQVTKLMWEGIVVACNWDHRIGDAYSIGMFMAAWAEVSRTNSLTLIPNFRRSLLSPRHPGSYDKSLDNMYMPVASLSPLPKHESTSSDQFISRIYHLSASALNQLQDLSFTYGTTRTKLESFAAFLWKLMANASGDAESSYRLGILVDGRSRLSEGPRSALYRYFGNVVSIPHGEATVKDLKSKPLGWAAKKVNELVGCATNGDHFQGLIDYVEGKKPNPMMTRVYYRGADQGPAIVVSHARVLDPSKMDFGWPSFLDIRALPLGRGCQICVVAAKPPGEWRLDWSTCSIYRKPSSKPDLCFGSAVAILKKSLPKVLVHYSPLVGEMVTNSSGEPDILCNNMGVEFIEAHADIELSGLKLHDPDVTIQGKLVPSKGRGVLSVHVELLSPTSTRSHLSF